MTLVTWRRKVRAKRRLKRSEVLWKRFMRTRDRGGKAVQEEEVEIVGVEMSSTKGKRTKSKNSSTDSKKRKAAVEEEEEGMSWTNDDNEAKR
jgi:hypothetical protein